jgi:hypothetical protein
LVTVGARRGENFVGEIGRGFAADDFGEAAVDEGVVSVVGVVGLVLWRVHFLGTCDS